MNGSTTFSTPTSAAKLPGRNAPAAAGPRPNGGAREPKSVRPIAIGFAIILAVSIAPSWIYYELHGQPVPWSRLASESLSWALWGLVLPGIIWAARRVPVDRSTWAWALPAHLGLGTAAVLGITALTLVKNQLVIASQTGILAPGFLARLPEYLVTNFQAALVIYGGIVTAVHTFDAFRRLKDREVKASQLEADLARAQLTVLKMQLEPHFLFNTLNAISALVRGNPDGAERMVIRLSELLRLSLASAEKDEVPLEEELRFLGVYLDIQKTRFGDRLRVRQEIPDNTRAASVPTLLLQPLVENSIRHGLERRAAPLTITLRATRLGNRLRVEVEDDGPGLPEEAARRNGVGLANTRARLERLYGAEQEMTLANLPDGGTRVTMELPQR